MNASVSSPVEPAAVPKSGSVRFAFASGSRPLSGYTIKRGVGRGGFGEVYYALSDAGKEVALKVIRHNLEIELRGITHCLNLKHPNLISIFDIKQDDQDNRWVIMEYVAGGSLEEVLEQHPHGLPPDQAMTWLRGIAAGVAYLHDHGIVHRDLKPANIFCDEGIVKLGDYGLSKFISCSRRSGQTESIGTVHYMAPEVANGRYGKEIDIYALGILLYELLTGHVPFEGESIGEVLMKHLTADPDLSSLPEPYRTVIARTLVKDPAKRFSTVEELMAQLPADVGVAAQTSLPRTPVIGARSQPHAPTAAWQAPAAAAAATALATTNEEPIWRWLKQNLAGANQYWTSGSLSTPTKIAILLGGVYLVATNAPRMMGFVVAGAMFYGVYRLIREIALLFVVQPPPLTPAPVAAPPQPRAPQAAAVAPAIIPIAAPANEKPQYDVWGRRRIERAVPALVIKTRRERFADLLGSLLMSFVVVAATSLVMTLLRGRQIEPQQYAWLALVGVLGSWSILIPAKLWEGTHGDPVLRRFALLILGLGLGALAYGIQQSLFFNLNFEMNTPKVHLPMVDPTVFYDAGGNPLMAAYLTYFGFLFAVVRWWRQADPLRKTRLSFGSLAMTLLAAWILNMFWPFPQPWGLMLAATISVAVQLSSPWSPNRRRV